MNATTEIISILSAMGAKPARETRPDGSHVIRINAPIINKEDSQK